MTKRVNLQFENAKGIVQYEDEIYIGEDDTLIVQYPERKMSHKEVHQLFEGLREGLQKRGNAIAVPESITFKVLKKT